MRCREPQNVFLPPGAHNIWLPRARFNDTFASLRAPHREPGRVPTPHVHGTRSCRPDRERGHRQGGGASVVDVRRPLSRSVLSPFRPVLSLLIILLNQRPPSTPLLGTRRERGVGTGGGLALLL
jgi:hypothetical protein